MNCLICDSSMFYYFSKNFDMPDLANVDYFRCNQCGFCASQTHFDMSDEQWSAINNAFHSVTHYAEGNPYQRNERYFNQAQMLNLLSRFECVNGDNWLDWGCGVGAVASLLKKIYGLHLNTYDKYFTPLINEISPNRLLPRTFDLVLNTAVFEHVRDRATLDEIEQYVKADGCLAVHTLVPESVPKNPEWMYLLPVHTAFHTNKSMQILMDDWHYTCSVYNEHSKLWVMFKGDAGEIEQVAKQINSLLGWQYLKYKTGFMDYWQ